jgi:hypothetical protein
VGGIGELNVLPAALRRPVTALAADCDCAVISIMDSLQVMPPIETNPIGDKSTLLPKNRSRNRHFRHF